MGKQTQKLDERYPDPPEPVSILDKLEYDEEAFLLTRRQCNELGGILGRNILTSVDLIAACTRLTNCNVEGVNIQIEPGVLIRLKSRAMRQTFSEYLKVTITRLLHGEVGW